MTIDDLDESQPQLLTDEEIKKLGEMGLTEEEVKRLCEGCEFDLLPGGNWAMVGIGIAIIATLFCLGIALAAYMGYLK